MEEMDYKEGIRKSRYGCLGGSDGRILERISVCGYVPKSSYKRMAVVKGLIEQEDRVVTGAMSYGDYIEGCVYRYLSDARGGSVESNPLWESEVYSRRNVRLICHPDFVYADKAKKVLNVYECKCTKFGIEETKGTYRAQLFIEHEIAEEVVKGYGKGWKVRMFLVHYNTEGLDLGCDDIPVFDADRLTVVNLSIRRGVFGLGKAMDIADAFLEDFDFYAEGDEVDARYLPENVSKRFSDVARVLNEIKEKEQEVEEFKAKLYDFLSKRGVKKVKFDDIAFSVVEPQSTTRVDYKGIFEKEIMSKHPRKGARMMRENAIKSERNGYIKITIKNK
jgi:hypothetical protein